VTCDSTRGEWSTPTRESRCPDCNAVMPVDKGPMTTWMADRHRDARLSAAATAQDAPSFRINRPPKPDRNVFMFGSGR
jgi:hypothetical protein